MTPFFRSSLAYTLVTALSAGTMNASPLPQEAKKASAESPVLAIQHDPLPCVTTEIRPEVDAALVPDTIERTGFVYFRARGEEDFYYVTMKAQPTKEFAAELPRPMPGIPGIDYYIRALDNESLAKKTPQFEPAVTEKTVCDDKQARKPEPEKKDKELLTVGLTREGQNPVPPGFNKADIGKIILVSGAVVGLATAMQSFSGAAAGSSGASGAGAGAGGGVSAATGGISTLGIVGIGAGAAVVAGVAIAAGNGGNSSTEAPNRSPVINSVTLTPLYGSAPLLVNATASATDPDNDPVTVTWSFGTGNPVTGATATFTYPAAGTFTVTATATDNRGGSSAPSTAGSVKVDPSGTPQFLTANVSWSGNGDLDVRLIGPGGLDVATVSGGRRVPAGCSSDNRTESVLYQGNALPPGSYTLFVRHAGNCGATGVNVTFNYATLSGTGSKCQGFGTVAPGAEVTACSFNMP